MRAVAPVLTILMIAGLPVIGAIDTLFFRWYDFRAGPEVYMYILGIPLNSPYPGEASYSITYETTFTFSYSGIVYYQTVQLTSYTLTIGAMDGESVVPVYLALVRKYDVYDCTLFWCSYVTSFVIPVWVASLPSGTWAYEGLGDPVDNTIPVIVTVDQNGQEIGRYSLDATYKQKDHSITVTNSQGIAITITQSNAQQSGIDVNLSVGGGIGISVSLSTSFRVASGSGQTIQIKYHLKPFIRNGNVVPVTHNIDFQGYWNLQNGIYPIVWAFQTN